MKKNDFAEGLYFNQLRTVLNTLTRAAEKVRVMYAVKVFKEDNEKSKLSKDLIPFYIAEQIGIYEPNLTRNLEEALLWSSYIDCELWLLQHQNNRKLLSAEIIKVVINAHTLIRGELPMSDSDYDY